MEANMAYKIVVQRKSEHKDVKKPNTDKVEDSTLGELNVYNENGDSIFQCYTCENIGPSTDTPNQDKRIMPRVYNIEWTLTSKNASLGKNYPKWIAGADHPLKKQFPNFSNIALWITCDKELPSFRSRRILIHIGNRPQETEGCILVGKTNNNDGTIGQSTICCHELFSLIEKLGIENIESFEVREIE